MKIIFNSFVSKGLLAMAVAMFSFQTSFGYADSKLTGKNTPNKGQEGSRKINPSRQPNGPASGNSVTPRPEKTISISKPADPKPEAIKKETNSPQPKQLPKIEPSKPETVLENSKPKQPLVKPEILKPDSPKTITNPATPRPAPPITKVPDTKPMPKQLPQRPPELKLPTPPRIETQKNFYPSTTNNPIKDMASKNSIAGFPDRPPNRIPQDFYRNPNFRNPTWNHHWNPWLGNHNWNGGFPVNRYYGPYWWHTNRNYFWGWNFGNQGYISCYDRYTNRRAYYVVPCDSIETIYADPNGLVSQRSPTWSDTPNVLLYLLGLVQGNVFAAFSFHL
ncbi:MAG: hypothetical protein ACK5E4_02800 [Planctomycetia bacterium]